jgi:hypothetical protein
VHKVTGFSGSPLLAYKNYNGKNETICEYFLIIPPKVHLVHQIPFIFERATITLVSNNNSCINSIRKKEEVKAKAHSCF